MKNIIQDCAFLSSGTIATLTGFTHYKDIEKVQGELVNMDGSLGSVQKGVSIMTGREKQRIIAIIEIAKAGVEQSRDKVQIPELSDTRTGHYLAGERDAYEAVLNFLQTGCVAGFMMWCNSSQRILIDDIKENRIKV